MIWTTLTGRWLARYGEWRLWFAWRPVSLEPQLDSKHAEPVTRAWLCVVWRIGVLVKGQRFWLYRAVDEAVLKTPAVPDIEPAARGGRHLRLVK